MNLYFNSRVGYAIACLGAFVAIFAATMALVNNDMKESLHIQLYLN